MKNKSAYVFVNGNLEDNQFLKTMICDEDLIIACDGGLEVVKQLKLKPDMVVGDFDSSSSLTQVVINAEPDNNPQPIIVDDIKYFKYPTDKYFLDSELSIDHAIKTGANRIRLVNTIGDELDHLIGTIFLLSKEKYKNIDLSIITSKQIISYQSGIIEIHGEIGQKVSLIPINGEVAVKSSIGLKYDPSQHTMSMQDNIGTRNELTERSAEVVVKSGSFLVVENLN